MESRFAVVSDETLEAWRTIPMPTMQTEPYDLSAISYYMTLGLFNYDTSLLELLDPEEYDRKFGPYGQYDGWSLGSNFFFDFYQFTDDPQAFGACIAP